MTKTLLEGLCFAFKELSEGMGLSIEEMNFGSQDLSSVNTTSEQEMLFEPDPEIAFCYVGKYQVYKKIHDALKQLQPD